MIASKIAKVSGALLVAGGLVGAGTTVALSSSGYYGLTNIPIPAGITFAPPQVTLQTVPLPSYYNPPQTSSPGSPGPLIPPSIDPYALAHTLHGLRPPSPRPPRPRPPYPPPEHPHKPVSPYHPHPPGHGGDYGHGSYGYH